MLKVGQGKITRDENNTTLVVKSPAVIQTTTITTPKMFFLTRRCWNGRNTASVRSQEIAVRFNNDAKGKNT